jgi:hypothetical protein
MVFLSGGVAGACVLIACSSPPPVSSVGNGPPVATEASVAGEGGEGGETTPDANGVDAGSGDAGIRDTGSTPEAPYELVDVASLPDAQSLDATMPCDFLSGCSGCCEGDGACAIGTDPTACGTSGNACVDCTQSSQTCNAATLACQ